MYKVKFISVAVMLATATTAFAGGIGSGVSTLVSDIFINNGHY